MTTSFFRFETASQLGVYQVLTVLAPVKENHPHPGTDPIIGNFWNSLSWDAIRKWKFAFESLEKAHEWFDNLKFILLRHNQNCPTFPIHISEYIIEDMFCKHGDKQSIVILEIAKKVREIGLEEFLFTP